MFDINDEISNIFWDKDNDMCSMRIMAHKGFDKLSLINMIILGFDVIIISILFVVLVLSFILSTILSQLWMLSISSLWFRLTLLRSSLRKCWGVSGDSHGLRRRATLLRWNARKGNVRHPRTAL